MCAVRSEPSGVSAPRVYYGKAEVKVNLALQLPAPLIGPGGSFPPWLDQQAYSAGRGLSFSLSGPSRGSLGFPTTWLIPSPELLTAREQAGSYSVLGSTLKSVPDFCSSSVVITGHLAQCAGCWAWMRAPDIGSLAFRGHSGVSAKKPCCHLWVCFLVLRGSWKVASVSGTL